MREVAFERILLIAAGYLAGSIPTAYLVGRWVKGVDGRQRGRGTVSGSTVYEHVARWAVVPVGLFDIAKAALPSWLGLHLNLGTATAAAAGLAAIAGHSRPVFLCFTGGRGLGCFLGVLLVIFPWGCLWTLGFLAVGWRLGDSAPFALLALLSRPLFARWMSVPEGVTGLSAAMLLLTLVKRVEANGRPLPPPGPERVSVIIRHLLWDRDIASHRDWIRQ